MDIRSYSNSPPGTGYTVPNLHAHNLPNRSSWTVLPVPVPSLTLVARTGTGYTVPNLHAHNLPNRSLWTVLPVPVPTTAAPPTHPAFSPYPPARSRQSPPLSSGWSTPIEFEPAISPRPPSWPEKRCTLRWLSHPPAAPPVVIGKLVPSVPPRASLSLAV